MYHAMKTYGEWRYSSIHSQLWRWKEVSSWLHGPTDLFLWKEPWYSPDRRLGGPQSWSEHGSKEKSPCHHWQ